MYKKVIITDDVKKLFDCPTLTTLKARTLQRFTQVRPSSLAQYVLNAAEVDVRCYNPVIIQEMSISGGYQGNTLDRERLRQKNFTNNTTAKELYKNLIDNDEVIVLWWSYKNRETTGGKVSAYTVSIVSKES